MNKEYFSDYLNNPTALNSNSQEEISVLTNQFPYCHSLQILKLLNLQITADLQYPMQLKIVAISSPNRFILKNHVEAIERFIRDDSTLFLKSPGNSQIEAELKTEDIKAAEPEPVPVIPEPVTDGDSDIPDVIASDDQPPKVAPVVDIGNLSEQISTDPIQSSATNIVDQFLINLPGIIRPKGDFFNPVDFARQSNLDNESIVTETLASIYAKQGHFSKSIKIYEILMLRIPEKSSYFAAQIEKIKQNANNQSKA